jgi:hypothetical protein
MAIKQRSLDARINDLGAFARRMQAISTKPKKEVIKKQERMSEREFIHFFGTKARYVRRSNRADFVGLMILGQKGGFWITQNDRGQRQIRRIVIVGDKRHVFDTPIPLKSHDSASNMARGLLNYVQ